MPVKFDNNFYNLLCQEALHWRGLYSGSLDNLWGPQTDEAYQEFMKTILRGKGTWAFFGQIEGEDIVVRNAWATCFGGSSDPQDKGETASGFPTKGHPDLIACALPMSGYGLKSLDGSPIPKLPWGLTRDGLTNPDGVHVIATTHEGKETPPMPVIDLGPARKTGNAIDLTVAAAKTLDQRATATNFKMRLDFRIVTGARIEKGTIILI